MIENPSKSEVIGRCGGDEKKPECPRRTDKNRTLKFKRLIYIYIYISVDKNKDLFISAKPNIIL